MQTKPGYKSTEFWLTVLATIVPLLNNGLNLHIDPTAAASIAGGAIAFYNLSRGLAKHGKATVAVGQADTVNTTEAPTG